MDNLVAQLTKLPGVGQRTAQRLAFHLLSRPKDEALALAGAIEEVKERVRFCSQCGNLTESELCAICEDARRRARRPPGDVVTEESTYQVVPEVAADEGKQHAGTVVMKFGGTSVSGP